MSTPKHNGHDPNGHFHEDSIREGYEVTDASVGGIVVFLVGLGVAVGVFFVLCFVMGKVINTGLIRADGPTSKWAAQNQIAPTKEIRSNPQLEQEQLAKLTQQFPTPQLQIDNGDQDLLNLHEREDLLLNHYSWINRSKGQVRIPIERAMEIIAKQGLPVAPGQQQQALMTGDKEPTVQMPLTNGFAPTGYEQEQQAQEQQAVEQGSSQADNR